MTTTKIMTLPILDEKQWDRSGIKREGATLYTTLSLVEGEILGFMEGKGEATLTEVVHELGFPEPIIMMAIAGLIREGLIIGKRQNQFVLLIKKI